MKIDASSFLQSAATGWRVAESGRTATAPETPSAASADQSSGTRDNSLFDPLTNALVLGITRPDERIAASLLKRALEAYDKARDEGAASQPGESRAHESVHSDLINAEAESLLPLLESLLQRRT